MKKSSLLLLALLLTGGLATLFPCDITMETAPAVAGSKKKILVTLSVESIHRRCPLAIDKTALETEGLVIEKQGQWQKVDECLYKMDLIVSLKGKSKGEIRVLRTCPKRGLQKEIFEIKPLP